MPRKTPKPRKTGRSVVPANKNRRAARPDPAGGPPRHPTGPARDKRFDRRPPKFPGRLGGR